MDLDRFCRDLSSLFTNWAQPGCTPRNPRFAQLLASVEGMTTPCILQLLNYAVACLHADEVYCEVGCYRGATLCGALLDQPQARAEAVDNFSQFDSLGRNHQILLENLRRAGCDRQVQFFDQDFVEYFLRRKLHLCPRIGAYFCDGAHDYRSQLMGLLLITPQLADRAVLVVDDANHPPVRQATWDFLAANPAARLILEVQTPENGYPDFWNGLQVLAWEAGTDNGYDFATIVRNRGQ